MGKPRILARLGPYRWTIVGFLVIDSPQWVTAIWNLGHSEPIFVVAARQPWGHLVPSFSPYYVTVPVGLLMWALTWYGQRRTSKGCLEAAFAFQGTVGYLTVRNAPTGTTVKSVRAEFTEVDPPLEFHQTLPLPLLMAHESWDSKEPATLDVDLPPGRAQTYIVCDLGGARMFYAHAFKIELLKRRTRFTVTVTGDGVKPITTRFGIDPPSVSRSASTKVEAPDSGLAAGLPGSGVTATGGVWEREYAQRLLDQQKPLNVDVQLIENSGGTPGLLVKAVNQNAIAVENAVIVVTDIRWWDEHSKQFVTAKEIHEQGTTFRELEIGRTTLHPRSPEQMGFIRAEGNRLELQGRSKDNPQDRHRWQTLGGWQISFQVSGSDGRKIVGARCLWRSGSSVIAWTCPTPSGSQTTSKVRL